MNNYFIVQYIADSCGDISIDDIEGVFTLNSFNKWLKETNEMRVEEGNMEFESTEFRLIETTIYN